MRKEITVKEDDGKMLILSDIHYSYCDTNLLKRIVEEEEPSLISLLIVKDKIKELLRIFKNKSTCR